jgi:hypothetical protein
MIVVPAVRPAMPGLVPIAAGQTTLRQVDGDGAPLCGDAPPAVGGKVLLLAEARNGGVPVPVRLGYRKAEDPFTFSDEKDPLAL